MRDGRIEGAVAFESPAALCGAPLLRRDCRYERLGDGGFELRMLIPARTDIGYSGPGGETGASARIRIRTAARILGHNSSGPIRRGNVLAWTLPLERLRAEGLEVRVRTDKTSVFAYTARTVARSALIALSIAVTALVLLLAEGRRRLGTKGRGEADSRKAQDGSRVGEPRGPQQERANGETGAPALHERFRAR